MERFLPLIQFLLPEFILENFELTSIDRQDGVFQVHIEEENADEQNPERKNRKSRISRLDTSSGKNAGDQ